MQIAERETCSKRAQHLKSHFYILPEETDLSKRDYYEVLGVSRNATDQELKALIVNLQ